MENQENKSSGKNPVKKKEVLLCASDPREEIKFFFNKSVGKNPDNTKQKFWNKSGGGTVTFEQKDVIDYLEAKGYGKYYIDKKEFIIVKKDGHILREVTIVDVKESLIQDLENKNEEEVLKAFYEAVDYRINKLKLELLPTLKSNVFRDDKEKVYFTFENAVVKVSKDNVEQIKYDELPIDSCVYESQIIARKFEITKEESVFKAFVYNVANKNDERFESLKSAIGFLLNRYNSPIERKAIIFTDEQRGHEGQANGGTGKSLMGLAVGFMRQIAQEDGKSFKANKSFPFQNVNYDTEIICLNDVNKDFDLESFYSILTDGLTVEKKYKNPFRIDPDLLPKILITSNYIIGGRTGFTDERRRFEIEFSSHYGKHLRPAKEFGHQLFNDWDNTEWNKFYNFMISCVQLYLTTGLIEYKHINMDEKRMIAKTSEEFADFFISCLLPQLKDEPVEFEKQTLRKICEDMTGIQLYPRTFTKYFRECCYISSIDTTERESNGKSYIILVKHITT